MSFEREKSFLLEVEREGKETIYLADDGGRQIHANGYIYIYVYIKREKKRKNSIYTGEYTRDDEKRLQFFEVYDET